MPCARWSDRLANCEQIGSSYCPGLLEQSPNASFKRTSQWFRAITGMLLDLLIFGCSSAQESFLAAHFFSDSEKSDANQSCAVLPFFGAFYLKVMSGYRQLHFVYLASSTCLRKKNSRTSQSAACCCASKTHAQSSSRQCLTLPRQSQVDHLLVCDKRRLLKLRHGTWKNGKFGKALCFI